jgi:hypothetical protein
MDARQVKLVLADSVRFNASQFTVQGSESGLLVSALARVNNAASASVEPVGAPTVRVVRLTIPTLFKEGESGGGTGFQASAVAVNSALPGVQASVDGFTASSFASASPESGFALLVANGGSIASFPFCMPSGAVDPTYFSGSYKETSKQVLQTSTIFGPNPAQYIGSAEQQKILHYLQITSTVSPIKLIFPYEVRKYVGTTISETVAGVPNSTYTQTETVEESGAFEVDFSGPNGTLFPLPGPDVLLEPWPDFTFPTLPAGGFPKSSLKTVNVFFLTFINGIPLFPTS